MPALAPFLKAVAVFVLLALGASLIMDGISDDVGAETMAVGFGLASIVAGLVLFARWFWKRDTA